MGTLTTAVLLVDEQVDHGLLQDKVGTPALREIRSALQCAASPDVEFIFCQILGRTWFQSRSVHDLSAGLV